MGLAGGDEERGLGSENVGTLTLDGSAAVNDEPSQRTLCEDRDRLARRVDVLTTRITLMAERERRAGGRLIELEVRTARAEELAERQQEHIEALQRTVSWRVTSPLRRIRALRRN